MENSYGNARGGGFVFRCLILIREADGGGRRGGERRIGMEFYLSALKTDSVEVCIALAHCSQVYIYRKKEGIDVVGSG